jgi:thymidylate synthase ThyX
MWRHVFKERALNKRAQWQIRELMLQTLKMFQEEVPVVFEDLKEEIL